MQPKQGCQVRNCSLLGITARLSCLRLVRSRPVVVSMYQPTYLERIMKWMRICHSKHKRCHTGASQNTKSPCRAARLLNLQPGEGHVDICLVPFEKSTSPYAALSYSWGDHPPRSTTTSRNIQQRLASIDWETEFPSTFKDAVELCRQLQIRHLRIDALCIIQPRDKEPSSSVDGQSQSSIMGDIYANATLTIAAEGPPSSDVGLFPSRAPFDVSPRSCPLFPGIHNSLYVRVEPPAWVASVAESPLQERAWVLQERLLSTRLVHFAQDAVFWECTELCASEF